MSQKRKYKIFHQQTLQIAVMSRRSLKKHSCNGRGHKTEGKAAVCKPAINLEKEGETKPVHVV